MFGAVCAAAAATNASTTTAASKDRLIMIVLRSDSPDPHDPPDLSDPPDSTTHGNSEGATRFFVACSKAYAIDSSFGSLQARPLKLTPIGPGFALKPDGNGGVGSFGTSANGTMTVG